MREETLCKGYQMHLEQKVREIIEEMGEKWLLHPIHAPEKGHYNAYGRKEDGIHIGR